MENIFHGSMNDWLVDPIRLSTEAHTMGTCHNFLPSALRTKIKDTTTKQEKKWKKNRKLRAYKQCFKEEEFELIELPNIQSSVMPCSYLENVWILPRRGCVYLNAGKSGKTFTSYANFIGLSKLREVWACRQQIFWQAFKDENSEVERIRSRPSSFS